MQWGRDSSRKSNFSDYCSSRKWSINFTNHTNCSAQQSSMREQATNPGSQYQLTLHKPPAGLKIILIVTLCRRYPRKNSYVWHRFSMTWKTMTMTMTMRNLFDTGDASEVFLTSLHLSLVNAMLIGQPSH